MKFKKSILAAGTIAAIAAPVATVVACGAADDGVKVTNIKERTITLKGDAAQYRTTVITDSGRVTDKSFNQSAFEATNIAGKGAGVQTNYIEPTSKDKITEGYDTAVQNGAKLLVLPGFTHMDYVKSLPAGSKAIVVDGWIDAAKGSETIALSYKVEQAAFMAGYAAADYLVNVKKDTTPKIGAWAGANAKGVSNYVLGFLEGVEAFNKTAPTTPVKFAGNTLTLNTGFAAGGGTTVAQGLVSNGADIIMGVAGPQTADGLKAIQGKETKIIGVDVDQSIAYASDKDKFFTSVEKNIGQSVYDTLANIYEGNVKAAASGSKGTSESTAPQWGTGISGDLDNGWTGIAPTQVAGAKTSIDKASASAIKEEAKKVNLGDDYDTVLGSSNGGAFETLLKELGITTITA